MPVKWKIFFALNLLLSLPALIGFIFLVIDFVNSYRTGEDYFFASIFLFGLAMITINGFMNIYILQRFFPDKLLPAGFKRWFLFCLIVNILVCTGILIVCIYAAAFEFSRYNEGTDTSGKTALVIIFLLWIVQVAVLIMQGKLPGMINRNNRLKMHSLIDSIGT